MMSVVTKKGDKGKTSLYKKGPKRSIKVSKASLVIAAIGAIDEVNSYLGVIASSTKSGALRKKVILVQKDLFRIGAILAGSKIKLDSARASELEDEIIKVEDKLPQQTHFVLPGGTPLSAHLMFARALVRKSERELTRLRAKGVSPVIFKYLNRLSDYLFILSREENFRAKEKEVFWEA